MIYFLLTLLILFFLSTLFFWRRATALRYLNDSLEKDLEMQKKSGDLLEKNFQGMASQVFQSNSDYFLKLAKEVFESNSQRASQVFEKKSENFENLVQPIHEQLERLQKDLLNVEKSRIEQFGKIQQELQSVTEASLRLREETSSLTSALRKPEVRGSWGELQLRRVVELAGMSKHCDFQEQVSVRSDQSLQKPDLIIYLPNQREIIVDAKAVLDAFLDASEAKTEAERKVALERHAKNLRSRVRELAKKSYWDQFSNSPDFVVLFVPNEALLQAAVEVDRKLLEDALEEKIILATPTTLIALLKAVAYGWQQEQVAENSKQILRSAKEFYDRLQPWLKKLSDVGLKLDAATKSYNESIGSLQSRVLPSVKRIQEMGVSESELSEMAQVERKTREMSPNND